MRAALPILVLVASLLFGCAPRTAVAVPPLVVEREALGMDVYCTRSTFTAAWPGLARRARSTGGMVAVQGQTLTFVESMHWQITEGVYDPGTHACWVVAADPSHPTAEERLWMAHEHCHRVQDRCGWEAAAPLWDALPAHVRTHPEIEARLREWRRTRRSHGDP